MQDEDSDSNAECASVGRSISALLVNGGQDGQHKEHSSQHFYEESVMNFKAIHDEVSSRIRFCLVDLTKSV